MNHKRSSRAAKHAYWQRQLQRWHNSGQNISAFCRATGLAEASFYYWRRRLAQRDPEPAQPAQDAVLLPVRVITDAVTEELAEDTTPAPPWPDAIDPTAIEIVLGTAPRIRVGRDFPAATLRRVLAVLEGNPC